MAASPISCYWKPFSTNAFFKTNTLNIFSFDFFRSCFDIQCHVFLGNKCITADQELNIWLSFLLVKVAAKKRLETILHLFKHPVSVPQLNPPRRFAVKLWSVKSLPGERFSSFDFPTPQCILRNGVHSGGTVENLFLINLMLPQYW